MLTRSRLILVLIIMVVTIPACTSSISVVTVQPPSEQVATTTPATPQNDLQSSETQDPTNQHLNGTELIATRLAQATTLAGHRLRRRNQLRPGCPIQALA